MSNYIFKDFFPESFNSINNMNRIIENNNVIFDFLTFIKQIIYEVVKNQTKNLIIGTFDIEIIEISKELIDICSILNNDLNIKLKENFNIVLKLYSSKKQKIQLNDYKKYNFIKKYFKIEKKNEEMSIFLISLNFNKKSLFSDLGNNLYDFFRFFSVFYSNLKISFKFLRKEVVFNCEKIIQILNFSNIFNFFLNEEKMRLLSFLQENFPNNKFIFFKNELHFLNEPNLKEIYSIIEKEFNTTTIETFQSENENIFCLFKTENLLKNSLFLTMFASEKNILFNNSKEKHLFENEISQKLENIKILINSNEDFHSFLGIHKIKNFSSNKNFSFIFIANIKNLEYFRIDFDLFIKKNYKKNFECFNCFANKFEINSLKIYNEIFPKIGKICYKILTENFDENDEIFDEINLENEEKFASNINFLLINDFF